ncbi:MAG: hypothetical protein ACETWK_01540 [Candidatus Aminicenantaceae bacterium]
MKKIIVILIAVFLVTFLAFLTLAAPLQKGIIPADAKWVFHFDMEKYKLTRLNDLLMKDEVLTEIEKKNTKFFKKYKINLLRDITGITIYGLGKEKKKSVLYCTGNFDQAHLLSLLEEVTTHRLIPYGKYTIHKWNRTNFGVFVAEHLVLFARDEEAIKDALDVIGGKKKDITSSPLISYVEKAPSGAFIIAFADNVSSIIKKHAKSVILKKTRQALFTITEQEENIIIKLNFVLESPEDAEKIGQIITGLIAMVNLQKEEMESGRRLPMDINLKTDDNNIEITLTYLSKDLVDIIAGKKRLPPFFSLGGFFSSY